MICYYILNKLSYVDTLIKLFKYFHFLIFYQQNIKCTFETHVKNFQRLILREM